MSSPGIACGFRYDSNHREWCPIKLINKMEPEVQITSTKDNYLFVNVFAFTCLFRQIKFNSIYRIERFSFELFHLLGNIVTRVVRRGGSKEGSSHFNEYKINLIRHYSNYNSTVVLYRPIKLIYFVAMSSYRS